MTVQMRKGSDYFVRQTKGLKLWVDLSNKIN